METIFALALVVALAVWDKWFAKKPSRRHAPDMIGDADRGHRSEE
jgi:hypothetical protein